MKKLKTKKEYLEALQNLTDLQCTPGNWNYDAYMHGMANGLLLALYMLKGESPKFLSKPEEGYIEENKKLKSKLRKAR